MDIVTTLYYTIASISFFIGFELLLQRLWNSFNTRSFAFTIDTAYLDWNTSFPAITVCEIFNGEKNWDLSEQYYGLDRNRKIDDYLSDITFFNGNCYACRLCDEDINLECPKNLSEILSRFRASCDEMLSNCYWNSKKFDCCRSFLPLPTEFGICYSINSIYTHHNKSLKLITNRQTGPGNLTFEIFEDVNLHLHSPNEIPLVEDNTHESLLYGTDKEIIVDITEVVNDNSAISVSINHRKCRFSWEQVEETQFHPNLYKFYGYSTCYIECSRDIQLKFCNCSHHHMPRKYEPQCDIKGLNCLTDNYELIAAERKLCSCLTNCEEPEYNIIYSSNEVFREEPGTIVSISMLDLPNRRYVRNTVKTTLDLLISIGGGAGLFFGASIITILEIIGILFGKIYTQIKHKFKGY